MKQRKGKRWFVCFLVFDFSSKNTKTVCPRPPLSCFLFPPVFAGCKPTQDLTRAHGLWSLFGCLDHLSGFQNRFGYFSHGPTSEVRNTNPGFVASSHSLSRGYSLAQINEAFAEAAENRGMASLGFRLLVGSWLNHQLCSL